MQALEEDDEDPRSHSREPRGYRERMARDHRTRGEETISPILVMKKRKEADEVGERQERVAP
jgi:hypothetical protein